MQWRAQGRAQGRAQRRAQGRVQKCKGGQGECRQVKECARGRRRDREGPEEGTREGSEGCMKAPKCVRMHRGCSRMQKAQEYAGAPRRVQECTGGCRSVQGQVMSVKHLPVELILEHLETLVFISHESGRTGFYSADRAR